MDIYMGIHGKSVDMDMDGKFHIHGKPGGKSADFVLDTNHESPRILLQSQCNRIWAGEFVTLFHSRTPFDGIINITNYI